MKLFKQVFAVKYRQLLITLLTIIILSVTATPTFADVSTGVTENSLTEFNQAFNRAWSEEPTQDRKSHLNGVCESKETSILQELCLEELETFLKVKKQLIVDSCYAQRANVKLCVELAMQELDLDKWIKQIHYKNLILGWNN